MVEGKWKVNMEAFYREKPPSPDDNGMRIFEPAQVMLVTLDLECTNGAKLHDIFLVPIGDKQKALIAELVQGGYDVDSDEEWRSLGDK